MLKNHYFIDDLRLSLWQEQEKSTKQVEERLMTEFVRTTPSSHMEDSYANGSASERPACQERLGAAGEMILWQRRGAV